MTYAVRAIRCRRFLGYIRWHSRNLSRPISALTTRHLHHHIHHINPDGYKIITRKIMSKSYEALKKAPLFDEMTKEERVMMSGKNGVIPWDGEYRLAARTELR